MNVPIDKNRSGWQAYTRHGSIKDSRACRSQGSDEAIRRKQLRIIILRHGKPDLPAWPWIQARDLGRWIEAYNSSGIQDKTPPSGISVLAEECGLIVTSDLSRSVESGRVLGSNTLVISDGLFREVGLPYSPLTFLKMPPYVWAVLFRFLWAFGFKTNGESIYAFRKRAQNAAMRLISLAHEHGSVLFVGHGLINRYIARELLSAGWKGPGRTPYQHWAVAEYAP